MNPILPDSEILNLEVRIPLQTSRIKLAGLLSLPPVPKGWILFAHGSGSGRLSARNIQVAQALNRLHLATLLFDLLTPEEALDRDYVFDIPLLASRLKEAYRWLLGNPSFNRTPVGFFGASTGAAAAATAAAELGTGVSALVSRGGRVDLARASLSKIQCPTLLIVGGWDEPVLSWNREVLPLLKKGSFKVIPKATHLFEEPHAMPAVLDAAGRFFSTSFRDSPPLDYPHAPL